MKIYKFMQRIVLFVAILVATATSVKAQVTNISGTINLANGVNYSTSTSLNLTGNVTFVLASGNNSIINIPIVSSSAFTVTVQMASGLGQLLLAGDNTYTGTTTISSGVNLYIGNNTSTGAIAGNIVNNGNLYFYRSSSSSYTYSGNISGIGSVRIESGTIILAGSNAYTGTTVINNGVMQISAANNVGSTTSTANITVSQNGALRFMLPDANVTFGRVITGTGKIQVQNSASSGFRFLSLTGNSTFTGTTSVAVNCNLFIGNGGTTEALVGNIVLTGTNSELWFNHTGTLTYPGVISNSGTGNRIYKMGSGTVILTGENTFTGGIYVSDGTLQVGDGTSGSIPNNPALLEVNPLGTLAFNPNSSNLTFTRVISGPGHVRKLGSNLLVLTGANTYTGNTNIDAGVLQIRAANNVGATGSYANINVNQNGTLRLMLINDYMTFGRVITGTGNIQVLNSSNNNRTLYLTGNSVSFTGTTSVGNWCSLSIGNGGSTGELRGNISLEGDDEILLLFNRTGTLTYPGVISTTSENNYILNQNSGTVILTGANTFTGGIYLSAGTLQVGDGTSGSIPSNEAAMVVHGGATLAFNPNSSNLTFSRVISGGGSVRKLGANTLTFSGVNTYTGNTNIEAGTLALSLGGSIENSASVNLNSATAKFNIAADVLAKTIKGLNSKFAEAEVVLGTRRLTIGNEGAADGTGSFAGCFSGTGRVTKTGTGTLTLSGNSTATGPLRQRAGTLVLDGGEWSGTYNNISSDAILLVKGNPVIGACEFDSGTIEMDVTATPPSKLSVTGNVTATGTNTLLISAATPVSGYVLIEAASGILPITHYTVETKPTYTNATLLTSTDKELQLTANNPVLGGIVTVTGSMVVESTLTANISGLTSNPSVPLSGLNYQWWRGGTIILGAAAATYTTVLADVGNNIYVVVKAANCLGNVTSAGVGPITKQTQTAPDAPILESVTADIITLIPVAGCEYSCNGGSYQQSPIFTGLTDYTSYTFTQRKVETAMQLPSPASAPATFKTAPITSFCGGDGTSSNPYLICYGRDLELLAKLVNNGTAPYATEDLYYKLQENIDLSDYGETWNDGKGWIPIGTFSPDRPFRGVFDGNSKVITGLYINAAQDYAGLFGNILNGIITNLGIENVYIKGGGYLGGLVGNGSGTISNCYTTGSVSGGTYVGGFAGFSTGGDISNCYSTCDVTGNGDYIGGFLGRGLTYLSYCYSTGAVEGNNFVGGLVGSHGATIRNCVAANADITATGTINRVARITSGSLTNNYANETMLVNGVTVSGGGLNNTNGANVRMTTLTTLAFYHTSSNWDISPWDIGTATSSWAICETEFLPHLRWQGINCTSFIPVVSITDLPTTATAGTPVTITGTVFPSNATNQTIKWSEVDLGTTEALLYYSDEENAYIFNPLYGGVATLSAHIMNGIAIGSDYWQDIEIAVKTIPVTDITDVPTTGVAKTPLLLTSTVHPENATFQTITWSVVNPGITGATITGNTLHTTNGGTVSVRATITKGTSMTENYTKDFNITITIIPVEDILSLPDKAIAGTPLPLTGIVTPSNATNRIVTYSVETPGTTGATISSSGDGTWIFNTTAAGTATVKASILHGLDVGTSFVKVFPITVSYQAVTNIINIPTEATTNIPLSLAPQIVPSNASYKTIEWSVTNAGTTNATISSTGGGGGGIFNATGGGIATIRATIQNGVSVGTSYTQEYNINVNIVPVTNIINVPTIAATNKSLLLTGTVLPPAATYKTIQWSMVNAGTTGATISSSGESEEWFLNATAAGTAIVRATIIDGSQLGTNYTKDFTINVEQKKWHPNPEDYTASMTMIAVVLHSGIEMRSDSLEIGAFHGEVCRGATKLVYQASFDRYFGFLMIYGDNNEQIALKVYDHATEVEYSAINPPLTFSSNTVIGTPIAPYAINIVSQAPVITTQSLPNGTANVAYSQPLTATGAQPMTWTFISGNFPNGLTLEANGVISGIPTTTGTFIFTVRASNILGFDEKQVSITIEQLVPVIIISLPVTQTQATVPLELSAIVFPFNATFQTIVWSVVDAGTTGASVSPAGGGGGWIFTATAAGTATIRATIENGIAIGTPYTQDFSITVNPHNFCGGNGTETNPYLICTAEDLALLATYINAGNSIYNDKYYKLNNNIDLSDYGATWNDGKGWIPIGTFELNSNPFQGVFDGNGKVITGLYINNTAPYFRAGVFGYIENGTIKNLGVENVNITAGVGFYVGGMVALLENSNIFNCYATGSVSGDESIGGLVGGTYSSSISNCYFSGNVSGAGTTGGLLGYAEGSAIVNSYSTGSVTGGYYVGGLVGLLEASFNNIIEYCYSTTNVSGTNSVGGLVGAESGTIRNCVAANSTITGPYSGRIVGDDFGIVLINNYANEAMLVNGATVSGGTLNNKNGANASFKPLRTLEFYNTSTNWHTAPWDIGTSTSIWAICEEESLPHLNWQGIECSAFIPVSNITNVPTTATVGAPLTLTGTVFPSNATFQTITWSMINAGTTGATISPAGEIFTATATGTAIVRATIANGAAIGYPYTQDFSITVESYNFCGGNGTETNPYIICTAEDLALLATFVNAGNQDFNSKYYKLNNDIDLSAYGESWNDGKGWIPIGTAGYLNFNPFRGVFDGNSKIITGLYINNTAQSYAGLFGNVNAGTITNLGVEDVNISGTYCVGALVGYVNNTFVENCYATGNVSGRMQVGGLVGSASMGSISNCYFSGNVSGEEYMDSEYIMHVSENVGGLVGDAWELSIVNCYSTGSVIGHYACSGLLGYFASCYVKSCYSTAAVSGGWYVGGLVGYGDVEYGGAGTISNCVAANSTITATSISVNRIIGSANNFVPTNNYANEAMTVNGAIITTGAHNNANGANVSLMSLMSLAFYNTPTNWNTAPWDIGSSTSSWAICEKESLPHLSWQDIECTPLPVVSQTIELKTGWNWVSANVLSASPSILAQMQTSLGVVGEQIKGYTQVSVNFGVFWSGTLGAISEKEMYQIKVKSNHSLLLTGIPTDPATTPVPLNSGWNWIGYIPNFSATPSYALEGAAPQIGDQIKNDKGFSTYFGFSWIGSIQDMNPAGGYQYFSNTAALKTFYYPSSTSKSTIVEYQPSYELKRTHQFGRYPSNMTVTAVVAKDNKEILGDHLEIQAFCGNECRGSIVMRYEEVLDRYLGYLMIHGEGDETIFLRVFDHLTGKEYAAENLPFRFITDQIVGGIDKPYMVNLGTETVGIDNETTGLQDISIYPNPTTGLLTIDNGQLTIDNVEIFDVYGRKISSHRLIISSSHQQIDVSHLAKGIYFLKIRTEAGEVVKKVVKQ